MVKNCIEVEFYIDDYIRNKHGTTKTKQRLNIEVNKPMCIKMIKDSYDSAHNREWFQGSS